MSVKGVIEQTKLFAHSDLSLILFTTLMSLMDLDYIEIIEIILAI